MIITTDSGIRARYLIGHRPDCFCLNGKRRTDPWYLDHTNPREYRDRRGGLTGRTTSWLQFRCLDSRCEALVLVAEFDLTANVAAAIREEYVS